MILRKPKIQDVQFVFECYSDWPLTLRTGVITLDKVSGWVRRWAIHTDEVCWIGVEADVPVAMITYRLLHMPRVYREELDTEYPWSMAFGFLEPLPYVVVDNILVHPDHRGLGYSDTIATLAWEKVPPEVTRAEFAAMDGPIAANITQEKQKPQGTYRRLRDVQGETGVLVKGEIRRQEKTT